MNIINSISKVSVSAMYQLHCPGIINNPKGKEDMLQKALKGVDLRNHDDHADQTVATSYENQVQMDYENNFQSNQEIYKIFPSEQPTPPWQQSQNAISEVHTVS